MKKFFSVLLMSALLLGCMTGCSTQNEPSDTANDALGGDGSAFGDSLEDLNAYDGYFEEEICQVTVTCISGTEGCYTLDGGVLTFTAVQEDSVYAVSGKLKGSIIIDIGDAYKFDLELQGLSLVSDLTNPITVISGDKVSITAKSGHENYIYDMRQTIDDTDQSQYSAAIYATVDLKIGGNGKLTLISKNNNGIHTKDDMEVKNLTLLVYCVDNALKGNDSVQITGGILTLIATDGDGIKTKNTDISSKGNQRGNVTITGGVIDLYAACDGIDAANDVLIDQQTQLHIYTERYSNYTSKLSSEDDPAPEQPTPPPMGDMPGMDGTAPDGGAGGPDGMDGQGGRPGGMGGGHGGGQGGRPGGMGGGQAGFPGDMGNSDKSEGSAKGIKAGNTITVNNGSITIKSGDDCIHANGGILLENGETSLGNVIINGGALTLYSNDDGIHADNELKIAAGTVNVTNSYEGLEGDSVDISGGNISILATDDGINGTSTTDTAITIAGGRIYVRCSGDGLDSNSRSAYSGIVICGGNLVVITDGTADSAIDTEQGYTFSGGSVIAIMSSRAMTNELTHCKNFSSVATKSKLNLTKDEYLSVTVDGELMANVKIAENMSAMVVYLGSASAKMKMQASTSAEVDLNGVWWKK